MFLTDQDHSPDSGISLEVRIRWLAAGMGIAIASISAIGIFLALRRRKKAQKVLPIEKPAAKVPSGT